MIAFSTSERVRRPARGRRPEAAELENEEMSALFQAVVEATEEAIYNSLFMATTMESNGHRVDSINLERVREILQKYNAGSR